MKAHNINKPHKQPTPLPISYLLTDLTVSVVKYLLGDLTGSVVIYATTPLVFLIALLWHARWVLIPIFV